MAKIKVVGAPDTGQPKTLASRYKRSYTRKRLLSVHDSIMHDIGFQIISGTYQAGRLLPPTSELRLQYKASASAVREALLKLATKGLITAKARIGTTVREEADWNVFDADILAWRLVSGATPSFLRMISRLRQAAEPAAAGAMAMRKEIEQTRHLEYLVRSFQDDDDSATSARQTMLALHLFVLRSAGDPHLRSLAEIVRFGILANPLTRERHQHLGDLYSRLVFAMHDSNADAAAAAMHTVISVSQDTLDIGAVLKETRSA